MSDLFAMEAKAHVETMTAALLELERTPQAAQHLEACMRAAHSLKGAARIVGLEPGVAAARAIEDCFAHAQDGSLRLQSRHIDVLLQGVDVLARIAQSAPGEENVSLAQRQREVDAFVAGLAATMGISGDAEGSATERRATAALVPRSSSPTAEAALRVSAEDLKRLLGIAAESLVESRRVKPYLASLLQLKRQHDDMRQAFWRLNDVIPIRGRSESTTRAIPDLQGRVDALATLISAQLEEVEAFDHRTTDVAHRLYDAALSCRMRPLADGIVHLPRLVRDLAQALGKETRLEISGASTRLDREILEKLESPLGHLLNNALDHGIESPEERNPSGEAGPSRRATRREPERRDVARHAFRRRTRHRRRIAARDDRRAAPDLGAERPRALRSRRASISLSAGFHIEARNYGYFRARHRARRRLHDAQRGRGKVGVSSVPGRGTHFTLTLPLSLAVVRALLVEIGGEPYAFPLARIIRTLALRPAEIQSIDGRRFFAFEGAPVALVDARDVFETDARDATAAAGFVIVLGTAEQRYGIAANRSLGERELVIAGLDTRLGKVKNIAAGALMEDGSPVLIVDVDDLLRTLETSAARAEPDGTAERAPRKRVLVVEDSLTIRQLQRSLLDNAGYEVEVAINGMDGWNAVRAANFDLVVTDVDMPRMDGLELVTKIKSDERLRTLAVIVVSYKDRAEDRRRAFEAGAAFFISKSDWHDATLLRDVTSCIGAATA